MSDRRVPRYEDAAALPRPVGAAPLGPSGHSPRSRGEIAGAATDDRRPTTDGQFLSSQGAYPAPTAVPSVRSLAGGTALSDSCELLVELIAAFHRESREAALLRAVAHYADALGIAVLAKPMEDQARAPP